MGLALVALVLMWILILAILADALIVL